jgi:uncharacterized protein (DUF1330 family)
MSVYLVAFVKITNRTPTFPEYIKKSSELLAKFNAEYLVRGPAASVVEGDFLQGRSMVVSKWPSMERAMEYWNSDEYQKDIKPLREGSGVYDIGFFNEAPK